MICFLTSRTDCPDTGALNPANHFLDELRRRYPSPCRALFICSDPDGWEKTDDYSAITMTSFENAGFSFARFQTLDGRNEAQAAELVHKANFLILSGGHVPTQNRFFRKIGLKDLLTGFDGVVIGISAGSMNCAGTVYAQPEEEGEAVDPAYERFLPGLGLTQTSIIPHYQKIKDDVLDGLRVMEDVAYPGRRFTVLPDGSYVFIENGKEEVRGEAYLLTDGKLEPINAPAADGGDAALFLRKPTEDDLPAIRAFRDEFAGQLDWLHGAQGLSRTEDPAQWLRYLALCEDERTVPEGVHQYFQFVYVRQADGKIVGMIGVRPKPIGPMETWGGHVGYCVAPSERHKGYASQMLRGVLPHCKALGLDRVLLTAGDENVGSVKTILSGGGVLEGYVMTPRHPMPVGRYWIDLSFL